jgi:hypothetical protein
MSDYVDSLMAQHEAMADVEESLAKLRNEMAERQLALYDEECQQYQEEGKAIYDQAIGAGMTELEAGRHRTLCGYGLRAYNPPASATVRYVAHR